MTLPAFKFEYAIVHVDGLGDIEVRPLSRSEIRDWRENADSQPLVEQERKLAMLAIKGEDVGDWLDSLPPFIAERVMEAVYSQATHGSDDSRLAEKNS